MATAITPVDLKASNFAGNNLTDQSKTTIVSGTGVQFSFNDADFLWLYNDETSAGRTFNVTVHASDGSNLEAIGVTIPTKDYTVPAKKAFLVPVSEAMRNPSTQLVVVDCSGANCQIVAYKAK